MARNSVDQVSLKDVYEAVNSLENKIGTRIDKIETRVDTLETFRDKTLGMVAVFSAFISLAVNYIWERVIGRQ